MELLRHTPVWEGGREGAIKRLIVLGSTGMEVLDEMFICSLNGDQKVQPLSNAAAAKTIGAPYNLEVPNRTKLQAQIQTLLIAAGMEKGLCARAGEKKPKTNLKKFSVLWGHFWSSIKGCTVPRSLSVEVSSSLIGM